MRRPWFTLLFNVSLLAMAWGQPGNDNCENAISIPFGPVSGCSPAEGATAAIDGDNLGATPSAPLIRIADDFGDGPGLSSASADVWYELTPTGNRLSVSLEGEIAQPVLLLFQGGDCAGKLPIAWSADTTGAGTASLESAVEPGMSYLLLVGGATLNAQGAFTLSATAYEDCSTCARRRGLLTADPPPVNGFYQAGQTVQFCYQASFWDPGLSLEWLHGVEIQFGPGWGLSTLDPSAPEACTAPSGRWDWYDSWQSCNTGDTFGPGFAFDAEYGLLCPGAARLDGDPGNNFGDGPCGSVNAAPLPLEFCWSVQVKDNFTTPEEANLNLEVSLLGDGYSGSWMPFSCGEEPATTFFATAIPDAALLPAIDIVRAPCSTGCDGVAAISGGPAGLWKYEISDAESNIIYSALSHPGADTITGLCAGTYRLEVSSSNGAIRQATLLEVEAGLSPEAQAGFIPGCMPGEPIQLVAGVNISGAATYRWTGPDGFTSSQANPTANTPGTYFLEVEVNGCDAPLASIEAVSGVPAISCEAFPNRIVFSWDTMPGDTAYAVTVLSGQAGGWLSPHEFEVTGLAPGEQASIELTKRGTGLCPTAVGEATCQALTCPLPMATPDTTICQGESVRLWANIPPNTSATWSPAAGLSCTNCIAPLASPTTNTVYRVEINYPDGCTATREVAVNVSSLPESILPGVSIPYCLGEPWEICLPEGNEYLWISPVGFITTGNCLTFPITTASLTGRHTVRVTLPTGCEFYDYLHLYGRECRNNGGPQIGLTPPPRRPGGSGIRAFPNPAHSRLNVEIPINGNKMLQLFRADGRQVWRRETEDMFLEIPAGQFPPGAYWLEVSTSEVREQLKVVVVR
ncbi:MAG: T9SS type A sorting domain-containing protein [Phaeodactylibacter sp.]|nr:T9SS type A sorting domain-containing protein [Phaeodactylibacter sp.]